MRPRWRRFHVETGQPAFLHLRLCPDRLRSNYSSSTYFTFRLPGEHGIENIDTMKINKSIGMILLAVYLIIDGLLGFGVNFGPAIFLLYLVALAAGVFILIGK